MDGYDFLGLLRELPAEELDRPIADLVDEYDRKLCEDCGRAHDSPWEALACDDYADARRRRDAGRAIRLQEKREALWLDDEDGLVSA